ncbi:MAG TPA: pentapeptide repeat-containing protein, partial [Polyangiaceae bacterium]|nr:pentapeptide repeat-containing protein [Polyangiaceae bacterium]
MMSRLAYRNNRLVVLLGSLAALYGCSSDGGDDAPPPLMNAAAEPAGANCQYGGLAFTRGADADGDGALGASEVASTEYVCNGSEATLIATESLVTGDANCAAGGMAIHRGADANGNGVLDAPEFSANEFVCNVVVTNEAGVCVFPAQWEASTSSCITNNDWSSSDLSGRSLAHSYLAGVNLAGADLTGADLSWSELRGSDLSGATLTDADLSNVSLGGADLTNSILDGANLSGVDLRGATLDGVSASALGGCPAGLPNGWTCLDLGASGRTLMSPTALIDGLDLSGADLTQTDLTGIQAIHLAGCPAQLPQGWSCTDLGGTVGTTLVGPGADLSGLDLSLANFSALTSLRDVQFT